MIGVLHDCVEIVVQRPPIERAERAGNLLRDDPWRLAQPSRQLEGNWRSQVAQLTVRRILQGDGGQRLGRQ